MANPTAAVGARYPSPSSDCMDLGGGTAAGQVVVRCATLLLGEVRFMPSSAGR
jgi:hypothetical protein